MPSSFDTLIFDFGGVITYKLFETHALTEQALAPSAATLTWRRPFDPAGAPLWQPMQADQVTERNCRKTRACEDCAQGGRSGLDRDGRLRLARPRRNARQNETARAP